MKGKLTVGELVKELSKYPKDSYVALSSDSEGNSFSIMMDMHCMMNDCYMENRLGHQYDFYDKEMVDKAKEEGKKKVKHDYEHTSVLINNLVPVIILFGSN